MNETNVSSMDKPIEDLELALAKYDREEAVAQSTPCPYPGCDGGMHESRVPAAEWSHAVVTETFDGWEALLIADPSSDPKYVLNISVDLVGNMTSQELRDDASTYEDFPAWLRSLADRMDALNAGK